MCDMISHLTLILAICLVSASWISAMLSKAKISVKVNQSVPWAQWESITMGTDFLVLHALSTILLFAFSSCLDIFNMCTFETKSTICHLLTLILRSLTECWKTTMFLQVKVSLLCSVDPRLFSVCTKLLNKDNPVTFGCIISNLQVRDLINEQVDPVIQEQQTCSYMFYHSIATLVPSESNLLCFQVPNCLISGPFLEKLFEYLLLSQSNAALCFDFPQLNLCIGLAHWIEPIKCSLMFWFSHVWICADSSATHCRLSQNSLRLYIYWSCFANRVWSCFSSCSKRTACHLRVTNWNVCSGAE